MILHIKKFGVPMDEQVLKINLGNVPCPTICAKGIAGVSSSQYELEINMLQKKQLKKTNKPPYKIPSLEEIKNIPWNGFTVASTFSGAGGSCTGYRMAGFKVVWANEFVPIAQATYKKNAAPESILDGRDIKLITAEEILKATNLQEGELDIFDGSPPCQAFSTAGKREKGWGKDKSYEHGAKQKNETLFDEYTRLLRGLKPKVFVAENVSGLIKGTAKGYFLEILKALKDVGYNVTCKVLDAQWLGVPQQRKRTIFIGVRNDLNLSPCYPKPLNYFYTVRDALPWLGSAYVRGGFNEKIPEKNMIDTAAQTVTASGGSAYSNHYVEETKTKVIHENGGFTKTECLNKVSPTITATQCDVFVEVEKINKVRIAKGFNGEMWVDAKTIPYSTVGTSPSFGCNLNSNGGKAEFIKPDGNTIRRKFTIDELKRICAFPDDFVLLGSYSQQWERLGNSVPPLMMKAISEVIRDEILLKQKG